MTKYSNKIFETIEFPVKNAEYVISYDTLDDNLYTYILARFIGDEMEVLLEKSHKINYRVSIDAFFNEIDILSKLFNAVVIGDKKLGDL